jgi:hypothetical protein
MTLRTYLLANMFDNCEDGLMSMSIKQLLDEVCELTALWCVDESGAEEAVESYFTGG